MRVFKEGPGKEEARRYYIRLRMGEDGMPSSSRYLATVRRAISMPCSLSILTIAESLKGFFAGRR